MTIEERFDSVNDEYLRFEKIENKKATRPDIHAFVLLDELFPSDNNTDLIECSEHDEYFLDIDSEQLETLTDDQILELVRCGISYNSELDCLFSFT